ncbi:MAG: hypothetical protein LIO70_00740 [Clostridiales bacterium]|nr:hypothetical protein [Clostridiales bacterium]
MQEGCPLNIELAGCVIGLRPRYPYLQTYCLDYRTDAPAAFTVTATQADIDYEREKSAREDALEGIPVRRFSDDYLETLAVYRKIAVALLDYDTLLFHGSAVAVDGTGYLFTARSGTGKSTHARLWREMFGPRAVMVNDDKPLLKLTPGGVTVYGTPWDGKHRLSTNIAVPLRAICILSRDATNHIAPLTAGAAYPMLLQQAYRPDDPAAMEKTLTLLDRLAGGVALYALGCNMERSAALVAWQGMNGGKIP